MVWCAASALATAFAWWAGRPDDWLVLGLRMNRDPLRRVLIRVPPTTWLIPLAGFGVLLIPSGTTQLAAGAVAAATAFGFEMRRRALLRRRAREFRAEVGSFLRAWAGELRSGLAPVDAAHAAVGTASAWDPVRMATAVDVPDALAAVATTSGGDALVDAAAAWTIADATGAPLSAVLERVSVAVQATVEIDREVAVEAAPARATARLMAFLPVLGVLLGTSLGADPIEVLFGTVLGIGCLVVGLALACVGVWWIERLVSEVEA